MARLPLLAALALAGASSALQIPLNIPLDTSWLSEPKSDAVPADDGAGLPLVDTDTLQSRISASALEARLQVLYDIATTGADEYGHPTRVIGSKGGYP